MRVCDINLRQQFYSLDIIRHSLHLANVLKLNDAELPVLATLLNLRGSEKEQLDELASQFELQTIALTCGDKGSLLYHRGCWSECSVQPVKVVDTVGAGDAFTVDNALPWLWAIKQIRGTARLLEVWRAVTTDPGPGTWVKKS